MTIAAQLILRDAVDELADEANLRWTLPELMRYLNDGVRRTAILRPDAYTETASHALVAGTRQTIPAAALRLIDIVRNTGGKQRAVRLASREMLDAHNPSWYAGRQTTEIQHFIFDPRDPRVFYVYPPAAVGASVELIYSYMPDNAAIPAPEVTLDALDSNVNAPYVFVGALTHYVLYRAWAKDTEVAASGERAAAHLALFHNELGLDGAATVNAGPNSAGNPNKNSAKTGT